MIITNRIKAGKSVLVVADESTMYLLAGMAGTERVQKLEEAEDALQRNRVPYGMKDELEEDKHGEWKVIPVPEGLDAEEFICFANEHYLDPGDYTAGKKFDTHSENCFLCGIGCKNPMASIKYYNCFVKDTMDIIIYESKNFIVVSEKGAMQKGFLMVCPKEHYLSVAQIPDELMGEYKEVCRDVEEMLKATYGFDKNVCFWEHGSAPSYMSAHRKSIMHAHTHVLIGYRLDFRYLQQIQCRQVADIKVASTAKYFAYHDGWNGQLYLSMDERVFFPRQYVRKIIVQEMGLPPEQYDWREVPFQENIDAQLYNIWRMLQEERCSRQILKRTRGFVEGYALRRK